MRWILLARYWCKTSSSYDWGLKLLLFWSEVKFLGEHGGKARHLLLPNSTPVATVPDAPHRHLPVDQRQYFCELVGVSVPLEQFTQILDIPGPVDGLSVGIVALTNNIRHDSWSLNQQRGQKALWAQNIKTQAEKEEIVGNLQHTCAAYRKRRSRPRTELQSRQQNLMSDGSETSAVALVCVWCIYLTDKMINLTLIELIQMIQLNFKPGKRFVSWLKHKRI